MFKKILLIGCLSLMAMTRVLALPIDVYQQAYIKPPTIGIDGGDEFGAGVAIDGDYMVVGQPGEDSPEIGVYPAPIFSGAANNSATNTGGVWVFKRQNNNRWKAVAFLKAERPDDHDGFGYDVAIEGDTIVVGAPYEDANANLCNNTSLTPFCAPTNNTVANSGAAYVFVREAGTETWKQQAYLKANNVTTSSYFGVSVSIHDNTITVGASGEDAAYVFTRSRECYALCNVNVPGVVPSYASIWRQRAKLSGSNTEPNDNFGATVDIEGDTLIVGADRESGDGSHIDDNSLHHAGAAYIFQRLNFADSDTWTQQAYLKASNPDIQDRFATSVAISGEVVVVGSPSEDSRGDKPENNSLSASGAAYVFEKISDSWQQTAYLKAINSQRVSGFGDSVDVQNNLLVVGAYKEHSGSLHSGAAYVYQKHAGQWVHRAFLKPEVTDRYDYFANQVSLSATAPHRIVAGVAGEDSGNHNPSDNSKQSSGAVYVFDNPATTDRPVTGESYPIGGVITGLQPGLQIALTKAAKGEVAEYLTVVSETNKERFRFVNPVNSTYLVSIAAQPNTQNCQISNGSGDVRNTKGYGEVYDVYVACGYGVGGQVSGLNSQETLMLSLNGKLLSVTSDGGFQFPQPLANNEIFEVNIQTQPTGQWCTVNDGSGTIPSAHVDTVRIVCNNTADTVRVNGILGGLAAGESITIGVRGKHVTLAANGIFGFSVLESIDGGEPTVSSIIQPSGQMCTVNNAGIITISCRSVGKDYVSVNGSWYDPEYVGSGFVLLQTRVGLVVSYYTYKGGENGKPQWLIGNLGNGLSTQVNHTYETQLRSGYSNNGASLTTAPNSGDGTQNWGTLSIRFTDCYNAVATLTDTNVSDGIDGSVKLKLQRLTDIADLGCDDGSGILGLPPSFYVSGSWYDPVYAGSGFYMTETPAGLLTTFYGYQGGGNGQALWLLSDVRADSARINQGTTYNFTLRGGEGNGASFINRPSSGDGTTAWGNMSVTFESCNRATLTMTDTDPGNGDDGTITYRLSKLIGVKGVICTE